MLAAANKINHSIVIPVLPVHQYGLHLYYHFAINDYIVNPFRIDCGVSHGGLCLRVLKLMTNTSAAKLSIIAPCYVS